MKLVSLFEFSFKFGFMSLFRELHGSLVVGGGG
jgi:hypothetical protein